MRAGGEEETEDEMVGWHHCLNGHEFEQTLGVGDGQGSLECCGPWGHKASGMTEQQKVILGTPELAVSVRSENSLRSPQTKQYFCEFKSIVKLAGNIAPLTTLELECLPEECNNLIYLTLKVYSSIFKKKF